MKDLNFYIAYLLTKYECVVIPGFGAFVVFSVPASKKESESLFSPPIQSLGFNPDIKHNDGLFAHFLSVIETISYKEADWIIKQYVNQLNEQLNTYKTVAIKWIGNISISSDNKIVFLPDAHLSCNNINFGFNDFYLPQLKELEQLKEISGKEKIDPAVVTISFNKRILARVASIAAAVLALSLTPVSLNNNSGQYVSNASFFPVYRVAGSEKETGAKERQLSEDLLLASGNMEVPMTEQPDKQTDMHRYYIIIASLSSKDLAEKSLVDFRQAGLPEVAVISKDGRHRIYVKCFEEKTDAETFLVAFRRNNPKYSDAWLFIQKN